MVHGHPRADELHGLFFFSFQVLERKRVECSIDPPKNFRHVATEFARTRIGTKKASLGRKLRWGQTLFSVYKCDRAR